MTVQLQEKVTKRANVWEQMKALNDDTGEMTAEQETQWGRLNTEYEKITASIDRDNLMAARETELNKVDRTGVVGGAFTAGNDQREDNADAVTERYMAAFQSYVANGMTDMSSDERAALRGGLSKDVKNAAGIGTASAGGYLVPQGFRQQIIEKMKAYGAVQNEVTVITTNTGNALPWPTNDDTGNMGALLAENTAATEQDLVFGSAQLGAYKYTSKIVRVSLEFLQDVDWMDSEAFLQRKFAERLARIHNLHFTTGTGTSQPQGIVTGAVSRKTAAAVAAFTADELIDLQHTIDPAYRNERSKFMLSDAALASARKLKDGQGRYLFQSSTAADMPSLLAGSRYVVNVDMPVPATGVKSVLYGDFQAGYIIRLVKAFELIRLAERYAEFGQVGFIAFDRADGLVQDNSAYSALVQA